MRQKTNKSPATCLAVTATLTLGLASLAQRADARPWVGVAMAQGRGGATVTRVLPTSPAEKAGLRKGDLIVALDGAPVSGPNGVLAAAARAHTGQVMRITVERGGGRLNLRLVVGKRPSLHALVRLYLLNTPAPNFEVPMVSQPGKLRLSSLRGKVVILYFWATWCDSCKLNMPRLKALHRKYSHRGLTIFSMAQDKRADAIRQTASTLGLPFLVGQNLRNRIGLLYKSRNVPTLILIDKAGIIRDYRVGSSYSFGSLEREIRRLL